MRGPAPSSIISRRKLKRLCNRVIYPTNPPRDIHSLALLGGWKAAYWIPFIFIYCTSQHHGRYKRISDISRATYVAPKSLKRLPANGNMFKKSKWWESSCSAPSTSQAGGWPVQCFLVRQNLSSLLCLLMNWPWMDFGNFGLLVMIPIPTISNF